jgi:hypothetical protein
VARATRPWSTGVVIALVLVGACTTSSDDDAATPSPDATSGELTASARGVTADTIKIGLTYPDLEALAKTGLIKVDNGPYDEIGKILVDDINARGGVGGRKLDLTVAGYSVLENADQLAACAKVTEDDEAFAVLGGFIGDTNLCVTQQHSTILISGYGSGFNNIALEKARAPWATWNAGDERAVKALVRLLHEQGRLEGKTIGVYGTLSASKPLIDLTVSELENAGYSAKETAINDVPASDTQAFAAQDKIIGNRFKDQGIDTVFVLVTVPPGTNFDAIDYHPDFYSPQTSLVAPGAFTNPYDKFPFIGALAANANSDAAFDTEAMRHCREVYKAATGKEIKPPSVEQKEGKSSGWAATATTCAALQIFTTAAEAAGPNLTPETWKAALEAIGPIELATTHTASLAPGKPDAQDGFQLMQFNREWKPNAGISQFNPIGEPIILTN